MTSSYNQLAQVSTLTREIDRIANKVAEATEAVKLLQDQIDLTRYASANPALTQAQRDDKKMLNQLHRERKAELEAKLVKLNLFLKELRAERAAAQKLRRTKSEELYQEGNGAKVPRSAAGKKPAGKKPAGKKPASKKPAGKKPASKKPAGKKPVVAKKSAAKKRV